MEIRSRVSGYLESINFKDGDRIDEGNLLFVIDRRPFEIALRQAEAEVEQARARLQLARSDVARAKPLARRRNIPERELESREARQREAAGLLAASQARLQKAKLDLEWTEVRAPISGRISDARVDVGNLISGGQLNATLLTTIVSLDPIHFIVETSEADFLKYSRLARAGQRPSSRDTQNPVVVRLVDEKTFTHKGKMDFVDNALDPNSGTLRARAIFDNRSEFLTPGVFGRMRLFGGRFSALLIPDEAIVSDQARKITMTVIEDGTVVPKVVTLGPIVDGLRVVRSGLSPTDRVIINGIQRARPGQKVTPSDGKIQLRTAQTN